MVSDLLVLATPGTQESWLAFRDVIEVDRKPVEDRLQRLEDLFLQTPRITGALRRRLIIESARFNIGAITRNVNVPTMALQILASSDQSRFTFEQDGEKTIDGIRTWEIDYEETEPPAMIKNGQGGDLFSHGTVWIEPSSGRVAAASRWRSKSTSARQGSSRAPSEPSFAHRRAPGQTTPVGQATPVPPWPQYPPGFLAKYCW